MLGVTISDTRARLDVSKDVVEGWNGGIPPLEFDAVRGKVLGRTEFRFVREDGRPVALGEPLFEGFPGDTFRILVQMRTETPLNHLVIGVRWPEDSLGCASSRTLLADPAADVPFDPHRLTSCLFGTYDLEYRLGGFQGSSPPRVGENQADRPLDYFRPLREWVDVAELRMDITNFAGSGDVPLIFDSTPRSSQGEAAVEFAPYTVSYLGGNNACGGDGREPRGFWDYSVSFEPGFVRVLGDRPPLEPPDFGIDVEIGEGRARAGDEVDVPVWVSARDSLVVLQLALEVNPEVFDVDSIDAQILSGASGEFVSHRLVRGESVITLNCEQFEFCPGQPYVANFLDTDPRYVAVQTWAAADGAAFPDEYPGEFPLEVARLRIRGPGRCARWSARDHCGRGRTR